MSETKQYIEHTDPPQNDEGWIEYGLQLLWSETDGYEYVADNAAEELAALRESNERLEGMANRLASQDAKKHRELIALRERVAASERIMQDTKKYLDAVIQSQGGVGMEYELGIVEDIQIYFDKLQESK